MRKVLIIRIAIKLIGTYVHWPTICEFMKFERDIIFEMILLRIRF